MKTLFLTGGSGEIGAAIATKFSQQGYNVIAPRRNELDLLANDKIIAHLKDNIHTTIDVFIHCAGFNQPKLINDIEPHDIESTMQINALSFYTIVRYLLNEKLIQTHGFILGISSIYGFLARKGRFSYVGSKHCLNGMIKTLALELGPLDIKANIIAPGFVDTKMTRQNNDAITIENFKRKIPLGKLADTSDIAEVCYFLCSPANRFITGQEIVVDGGYSIGGFEV